MDKPQGFDDDVAVRLLRRISQGDEKAFVELFRAINRRVFLFAMHRLGDRHDAEEVLNDAAFELWQHPERFRGDSRFMTYVLGIAYNLASSRLRSRGHREEDPEGDVEDVPDAGPTPFETLSTKETQAAITRCMKQLPVRQRTVLHLAYFEQLSGEEIGRIIECEANLVRWHLYDARRRMKVCLAASGLR